MNNFGTLFAHTLPQYNQMRIIIFLCLLCHQVFAQKHEIGGFIGGMFYKGEISEFSWQTPGGMIGVMARQNWNRAISTQFSVSSGNVRASDKNSKNNTIATLRNYSFNTSIFEFSGQIQYNFYDFGHFADANPWTPYLFLGAAAFNMSPKNTQDNNAPYSTLQFAIPFGVGAKFMMNENWNVSLQFTARRTFTDYIDDMYLRSGRNPKLFTPNPNDRDMYFSFSLGISYVFQQRPCPSFYKIRY
ncbi:MAG: hypothetical protein OHK0045_07140 [Raineya sp.]